MAHDPTQHPRFSVGDHVLVSSELTPAYAARVIGVHEPQRLAADRSTSEGTTAAPETLYELGQITQRPWPFHRWPKITRHHHLVSAAALTPLGDDHR